MHQYVEVEKKIAISGIIAIPWVSFLLVLILRRQEAGSHAVAFLCHIAFYIVNCVVAAILHNKYVESDEEYIHVPEKYLNAIGFGLLVLFVFIVQVGLYKAIGRTHVSTLYLQADALAKKSNHNASIAAFRKSYERAMLFEESETAAVSLARIGACQLKDGNADEALSTLSQALSIANQKKSIPAKMLIYGSIGDCYLLRNEYDIALSNKLMSLDLRRGSVFQSGFAPALVEIAVIYMKLSKYKDAIGYYEQALHRYKELGDKYQQANVSVQIGYAYRKIGDEGLSQKFLLGSKNTFLDLGKTKQAEYVQGVIDRRIVLSH